LRQESQLASAIVQEKARITDQAPDLLGRWEETQ
jgi:hypothetical protein